MENEPQPKITLDELARMMAQGFAETRDSFAELRAETKAGFAAVDKRFSVMGQQIDQLELKVDHLDEKVENGLAALRGVIGGLSHRLADHEDRIKVLEGE